MEHLEFAVKTSERSDIKKRLAGQFYTPVPICGQIAEEIIRHHGSLPRVVADPFCGDGRFVNIWLRKAHAKNPGILRRLETVLLWDYDEDAVAAAKSNIASTLDEIGFSRCRLETIVCDTFSEAFSFAATADLVLTNPPWDLLKPDSRDAVPAGQYDSYISSIRSHAKRLRELYPFAASANGKGMAGYELNLARAGLLACVTLLRQSGVLGIVLPATIFCDQASVPFRTELFRVLEVSELSYFPAETRAFAGVDQPFITLIGAKGCSTRQLSLHRRKNDLSTAERRDIDVPLHGEPLPLSLGGAQSEVNEMLSQQHTMLRMLEMDMRFGLWLGRELDETRISEAYSDVGVPFLKGRQVGRFEVFDHKPPKISPDLRSIPATVKQRRLAWRDVSRQNQKRRVQAALIPNDWITGNSLGVAFFRYGSDDLILCLLAVLNSLPFELQVRSRLLTAHVSLGVLRECAVPLMIFEDDQLRSRVASLVRRCIAQPRNIRCLAELERAVGKAYRLGRSEFAAILDAFPKLDTLERDLLLTEGWQ